MTEGQIIISPRAIALFHQLTRTLGQEDLAFHIAWAVNEDGVSGRWTVGFTPEEQLLAADPQMRWQIVAGRYQGILVVVDGPSNGSPASRRVEIDSVDNRTFGVAVV